MDCGGGLVLRQCTEERLPFGLRLRMASLVCAMRAPSSTTVLGVTMGGGLPHGEPLPLPLPWPLPLPLPARAKGAVRRT